MKYTKKLNLGKNKTFIVSLILIFGILLTFGREVVIGYYSGTSLDADLFRFSYSLPSLFVNNLGPSVISFLLFYSSNRSEYIQASLIVNIACLLICSLLIIFSEYFALLLAPGWEVHELEMLAIGIRTCSIILLLAFLSLPIRAFTTASKKPIYSSSYQLVLSVVFISGLFVANALGADINYTSYLYVLILGGLVYLAIGIYLIRGSWRKIGIGLITTFKSNQGIATSIAIGLLGVVVYKLINTLPRFIDRGLLSYETPGLISAMEYAFVLVGLPSIFLTTVFTLLVLPGIVKEKTISFNVTRQRKSLLLMSAALLSLGLFVAYILAQETIDILFGYGKFNDESIQLVSSFYKWLIFSIPFTVCYMCCANVCIGLGKVKSLVYISVVKLVLRVGILLGLFSLYKADSVVISFLLTEVVISIVLLMSTKRLLHASTV